MSITPSLQAKTEQRNKIVDAIVEKAEKIASDKSLPRSTRRRAERVLRKAAKRSMLRSTPDPAGNRAKRRAILHHVHSQDKPVPKQIVLRKRRLRRWKRKHKVEILRWDYPNYMLPVVQ